MADRNEAIDLAASGLTKRSYGPASPSGADAAAGDLIAAQGGDSDLIARAGVKLHGATAVCGKLLVEGEVEANLHAREIRISGGGSFVGRAEVEDAEIAGRFEGALRVKGRLLIRSTGRVSGRVFYGRLEIEAGGKLNGQITAPRRNGPGQREAAKSRPWRL